MNILVTGGTGMTGAYLLEKLVKQGHNVKALHRKTSNLETTQKIFNYLSKDGKNLFSKINWVEGDIINYNSVEDAMQNVDYVYHTAAMVSFKPSDKKEMLYANIQGTANIVNAALNSNIKKLCHVSSIASLGNSFNGNLITEETEGTKNKKKSDYSISKFQAENEVWRGIAEGLNAVIVNPSVIIGAGNWEQGSPRLIKTVWDGFKYFTTGGTGFVYVEDVVNIMTKLMESNISNERYILNAENLSYRAVFDFIAENLNKKKANIQSSNIMLHSFKIFDNLRYFVTGKEPRITKYTLKSAQQTKKYSNEKIKQALNYEFIPIKDAISIICKRFISEINPNL